LKAKDKLKKIILETIDEFQTNEKIEIARNNEIVKDKMADAIVKSYYKDKKRPQLIFLVANILEEFQNKGDIIIFSDLSTKTTKVRIGEVIENKLVSKK